MIEFIQPEFVHEDDRGSLKQLVSKGWSQVNVIHSSKGAIRGDHYHKENRELFYILNGSFALSLERGSDKQEHQIKAGDMFIIEAGVKHSFEFTEDTNLVAMYDIGVENTAEFDIHSG